MADGDNREIAVSSTCARRHWRSEDRGEFIVALECEVPNERSRS
jgi:hypothetical protein